MLTALSHIQLLRYVGPAAVVLGVAPQYLLTWVAWRLASLPLPRRVFQRGDEFMYDMYQSLVCFFFETCTGAEVIFYGDQIPWDKQENVIVICNHQSSVDWIVSDFLAIRQGSLGRLRYILKNGLKYLPLYGFYFAQHACIYVKRSGAKDKQYIARKLAEMKAQQMPMWLVIFPEGTRYNVNNTAVIEKSQEFASEKGLPVLSHVLTPRTKATEASFEVLSSDYLDAVYDLTIAYSNVSESPVPRKPAPSMTDFLVSRGQQVHVYCRRHAAHDIPKDNEGRKDWIHETFVQKDRILNKFYNDGGKMPGVPRKRRLPWSRTFPYFVFWMAALLPFLATKWGRSAYWKMWLVSSFGTVSYMLLLFGKVQG
ncbi:1-acyl-sn-glycerol-3-phosphate acyltransferase epsilon-like [Orbicella faveolata]|uniref:1-acyl-sn-glycerol-3-phosphate acyltransferase epsilon-like n=1 Tax=Orbicella faveolata TaxID=48498 RepID=UPI0009E1E6F6|nr:1-acyl-sn-glycerol-3-phosphate acyltransferase epsilon-like [Orbicella faveolata]